MLTPKIIRRLIILTCLINAALFCNAQTKDSIINIKGLPVKDGYIKIFDVPAGIVADPYNFLIIFSKDSTVYSTEGGRISNILKTEIGIVVIIRASKNLILSFTNLNNVEVAIGDKVKRGALIGSLNKGGSGVYELIFGIETSKKSFNYYDLIKYIKLLK